MSYLTPEIVLPLFAAAVFGAGVGWRLRAIRRRASDGAQLDSANKDIARLKERLREVGREMLLLHPRHAELENRNGELETTLEISRRDAAALRDDLAVQTAENERLRDAALQIADLRNEIFAYQARLAAMREQAAKLRGESEQAADQAAAERAAHRATLAKLDALESMHADCDFAFSALRDQILLLRVQVADLERAADSSTGALLDDEVETVRLDYGTSSR